MFPLPVGTSCGTALISTLHTPLGGELLCCKAFGARFGGPGRSIWESFGGPGRHIWGGFGGSWQFGMVSEGFGDPFRRGLEADTQVT